MTQNHPEKTRKNQYTLVWHSVSFQYVPVEVPSMSQFKFLCGLRVFQCRQNSFDSFAQFECLLKCENKTIKKTQIIIFIIVIIRCR